MQVKALSPEEVAKLWREYLNQLAVHLVAAQSPDSQVRTFVYPGSSLKRDHDALKAGKVSLCSASEIWSWK